LLPLLLLAAAAAASMSSSRFCALHTHTPPTLVAPLPVPPPPHTHKPTCVNSRGKPKLSYSKNASDPASTAWRLLPFPPAAAALCSP
jgi:hypothetical protein